MRCQSLNSIVRSRRSRWISKVLSGMRYSQRFRCQVLGLVASVMVAGAACAPSAPNLPSVTTPFDPMALYESAEHPFSIRYPADWTEHPEIENAQGIEVWRTNSKGEWFVFVKNTVPDGESLSSYVDWVIAADKSSPQHEMVSREQSKTVQELPAERLEFTISWSEGQMTVNALIYLHENEVGFRAAYGVYTPRYEEMKDMIAYSFGTFQAINESPPG